METHKNFAGFHRPEQNPEKTVETIRKEQYQQNRMNDMKKLQMVLQVGSIGGSIVVLLAEVLLTAILIGKYDYYLQDKHLFYMSSALDVMWAVCFACIGYTTGLMIQKRVSGSLKTIRIVLALVILAELLRLIFLFRGGGWIWTVFAIGWCFASYICIGNTDTTELEDKGKKKANGYLVAFVACFGGFGLDYFLYTFLLIR